MTTATTHPSHPSSDLLDVSLHDVLRSLDGSPHAVAVTDSRRRLRFMNRRLEALTGRSREQCLGLPCAQVVRCRLCMHGCVAPASSEEPRHLETDILTRERRVLPVRLSLLPLVASGSGEAMRLEFFEEHDTPSDACARCARGFEGPGGGGRILGRSPRIEALLDVLPVLARGDAPLFFSGETGVGKDVFAEVAHSLSSRSREPFVRVNVSPMPELLLDVELFGAAPGGVPWAETEIPGALRRAGGGTVYLAELGDIPLPQQARLLRYLEEGVVLATGATSPLPARCRLFVATNADMETLVRQGRLREDLARRLDAFRVTLPPLREREGDVAYLAQRFLEKGAAALRRPVEGFSTQAMELLHKYPFPGNIRELKNIVEYAVMVCQGGLVQPEHLPPHLGLAMGSPADRDSGGRHA